MLDQRAMWVFLLFYLVIYGAGKVSVDHLLSNKFTQGQNDSGS